jgi:ABC-type polysaccharide/polyol phosphate transport system ATPase subunit
MIDLKVDHVSKRYVLRNGPGANDGFGLPLPGLRPKRRTEIWALRDISFEVARGESVGIVGHNGAGKSTVLKLLSRITTPTRGAITIRGRLSALVEVGSGFHPELTGRENIYLNGSMLGMARSEIANKVDSIIDFAEVRDYTDIAVKKYSSGMYVRLGFSIAAHLEPDILLLDEVLAVGDAAFQAKCLDRIGELREAGRTIVLITHDLAALARLCDRALLLQDGALIRTGSPRSIIDEYVVTSFVSGEDAHGTTGTPSPKPAECRGVSFHSADSNSGVRTGNAMVTCLAYHAWTDLSNVVFKISLYWPSGYLCSEFDSSVCDSPVHIRAGGGAVEFHCAVLPLQPGLYRVDITLESNGHVVDRRQRCATLRVDPGKSMLGDFYFEHTFRVLEQQ